MAIFSESTCFTIVCALPSRPLLIRRVYAAADTGGAGSTCTRLFLVPMTVIADTYIETWLGLTHLLSLDLTHPCRAQTTRQMASPQLLSAPGEYGMLDQKVSS